MDREVKNGVSKRKCLRVLAKSRLNEVSGILRRFSELFVVALVFYRNIILDCSFKLGIEIERIGSESYLFVVLNNHSLQSKNVVECYRPESGLQPGYFSSGHQKFLL